MTLMKRNKKIKVIYKKEDFIMFEIIRRYVTFDFGTEKLLRMLSGCKVEVIDDHTAIVEGYQCQMDIYSNLNWGVVVR